MYQPPKLKKYRIVEKTFNNEKVKCVQIKIGKKEYGICEQASKTFWANSKKGRYGAGLCRTQDDPYKPVRTGLLGQMAFGKMLGIPVDTEYRQFGDKYDNLINGYKIDIKCSTKNYGNGLICYKNEWGKEIPLDKDIYVFSFVEKDDFENKTAEIIIAGYLLNDEIKKCKIKRGSGRHLNYVVNLDKTSTIFRLIDFFSNDTL